MRVPCIINKITTMNCNEIRVKPCQTLPPSRHPFARLYDASPALALGLVHGIPLYHAASVGSDPVHPAGAAGLHQVLLSARQ